MGQKLEYNATKAHISIMSKQSHKTTIVKKNNPENVLVKKPVLRACLVRLIFFSS